MIQAKKGFTLIELMIVVVIVGLLVAAATVIYSKSQQRARDSRRVQDIAEIFDALKIYNQQKYAYPHESDSCSVDSGPEADDTAYDSSNCNGRADWLKNDGSYLDIQTELVGNGYMQYLPVDPLNRYDWQYYYEPSGAGPGNDICTAIDCVNVLVGAVLELPTNGGSGYCISDYKNFTNQWQLWCDNL